MRRTNLKRIIQTGVNTIALASLVRRVGPKRLVRVAALATEGYLGEAGRDRRRPRK
ncbi:MAG TPA: hypothetical protein VII54_08600 [Gaiellaceae bacterium]